MRMQEGKGRADPTAPEAVGPPVPDRASPYRRAAAAAAVAGKRAGAAALLSPWLTSCGARSSCVAHHPAAARGAAESRLEALGAPGGGAQAGMGPQKARPQEVPSPRMCSAPLRMRLPPTQVPSLRSCSSRTCYPSGRFLPQDAPIPRTSTLRTRPIAQKMSSLTGRSFPQDGSPPQRKPPSCSPGGAAHRK